MKHTGFIIIVLTLTSLCSGAKKERKGPYEFLPEPHKTKFARQYSRVLRKTKNPTLVGRFRKFVDEVGKHPNNAKLDIPIELLPTLDYPFVDGDYGLLPFRFENQDDGVRLNPKIKNPNDRMTLYLSVEGHADFLVIGKYGRRMLPERASGPFGPIVLPSRYYVITSPLVGDGEYEYESLDGETTKVPILRVSTFSEFLEKIEAEKENP